MRQRETNAATGSAWTYSAGEWSRNRVRVYLRGSTIWIEYAAANGKRERRSLGHSDRQRAKQEADDIAARFGRAESRPPTVLKLSRLFEIYEREIRPKKSKGVQAHDRRAFAMFLKAFGANRRVETLNVRDWNSFIDRRRRGEIALPGREGQTVRGNMLQSDCKLLLAVLNFAVRARDDSGAFLLDRNPLAGLPIPREESPRRPVLSAQKLPRCARWRRSIPWRRDVCDAVVVHRAPRGECAPVAME